MEIIAQLQNELDFEYDVTKNFFQRFPEGMNDYKPHDKSMKLMTLAMHVAEIMGWPDLILNTSGLDFAAGDYKPLDLQNREDLLRVLDEGYQKSKIALQQATPSQLEEDWTMRNGETVLASWSKYGAIRMSLNQETHHRAQLGVYYRLLNIPIPGSYGPSADEPGF